MREALLQIKRELGPDAVILDTRHLPATDRGGPRVELTVADVSMAPPARRRAVRRNADAASVPSIAPPIGGDPPPALPEQVFPYYTRLVQSEVSTELATRLLTAAARTIPPHVLADKQALHEVLRRCIARMVPTAELPQLEPGTCRRVALVGPPGAGKTSTIAKLAAYLKLHHGTDVAVVRLVLGDEPTAETLHYYTQTLEIPLHRVGGLSEIKELRKSLDTAGCVLIDTPGIGVREQGRFARLAALLRAARPDEVHLVLPASLASGVHVRLARSFAPLGVSRIALTRLDEAVGFGVILNVVDRLKWHVSYLAAGQSLTRDLEPASGGRIAELILPPGQPAVRSAVV